LVSDVSNENATRKVTAAEFGGYIQATYGPGVNIYQADGSITGNRQLSGASLYSLTLASLTNFTVGTSGDINLNPGGEVAVGAGKSISFDQTALGSDVTAIKCRSNARTQVAFVAANPGDTPNQLWVNADTDVYLAPDSGNTIFNKNLAFYTTNGGEIADIDAATGKTLVSKEWVAATYPGTVTSVDSGGFVNGLFLTGGPITSSGTISISGTLAINNSDWVGTSLSIANGGTGASTAQDGINELTQSGGATTGDVLTRDISGNAVWEAAASAVNIYTTDGTVSAGRVATLTDTLTWTSGAITRDVNSIKVVEITADNTFPSTLAANTTYIVRGTVTVTGGNEFSVTNSGSAIVGLNRDVDKIIYTGPGTLMTVTDQDFTMRNLGLCATNATGKILEADNWTAASANNYGRLKVLELFNLKIANTTNIWRIEGFELVDVSNCLFWYISDGTLGCQFASNRHLEISSCEFYNWFEEGNPANLDFYHQIELDENVTPGATAGFGVVNINSCIIHPELTQNGIFIHEKSTTGFGTISSNTFTDTNLTPSTEVTEMTLTGTSGEASVEINGEPYQAEFNTDLTTTAADFVTNNSTQLAFRGITCTSALNVITLTATTAGNVHNVTDWISGIVDLNGENVRTTPIQGVLLAFNYSHQNTYITQANQGAINSNAKGTLSIQNNTEETTISLAGTSVVLNESTAAGPGFTNRPIFPTATKVITNREDCTFTYNTKIKGSFFVSINATVNTIAAASQEIEIRLRYTPFGGSPIELTSSVGKTTVRQQIPESIAFSLIGEASLGDVFDVVVRNNTTNDNIIIQEFSLNGHQF
jgi:hypothetical protein